MHGSSSPVRCNDFIFVSSDLEYDQPCFWKTKSCNEICFCQNTTCDCSYSNLTRVPQDLKDNVTELNITFNNIKTLPPNVFSLDSYRVLKSLDLSCNKISSLINGSFIGLPILNSLDISNNYLGYNSR